MAGAENRCPHDREPMLAYELDGVELDACALCGGTWLDAGEIEHIAAMSGVAPGPLSAALRAARSYRRGQRRCPRCDARLDVAVLRGRGDPIEVDRCPRGHGLFLDPGELEAVIAAFDEGEGAAVAGHLAGLFRHRRSCARPDVGGGEMSTGAIVFIAIVVLLVVIVVGLYNSLVAMRNQVRNAWSQIDVQLKRRHDLVPNLVETVRGYAKHERETLDAVMAARARALSASGVAAMGRAEGELSGALGRLMAVVEAYPDLKANQNFLALQEELTSTENRIAFARQAYNDQVMAYNTRRESFPANLLAGTFGFRAAEHFVVETPAEREAPRVSF